MKSALDQAMARLERNVKGRSSTNNSTMPKVQAPQEPQEKTTVVYLPVWPESARGAPNSVLRGALFAAIKGSNRQACQRKLLGVQNGIQIRFTGIQLDQFDLAVWEQAIHLSRQHPLGIHCTFTARAFLTALGRSDGKSMYESLKDAFARLAGCAVEITHDGLTYGGSLLEFYRDEHTGRYVVNINPKIRKLFDAGWTATDWEQRKLLKRKPLALWLQGFYATHAEPYPITVQKLWKWSGSNAKNLYHFKANLKKALNNLQAIGAIDSYSIDDDLVSVKRTPSTSQKKYLNKPKPHEGKARTSSDKGT